MSDYRQTLIHLKTLVNLLLPIFPILQYATNRYISFVLQAFLFLVPLGASVYVFSKKRKYSHLYLRKTYVPSARLFTTVLGIESPILLGLYGNLIWHRLSSYLLWGFAAAHVLFVIAGYVYTHEKAKRTRFRINSFDTHFKLALLAVRIGEKGERGLEKGEIVKIIKKTTDGYLVKNSHGHEFRIPLSAVETILNGEY